MAPDDFVQLFHQQRASAILRTHDQYLARQAMNAAIGGGFRIVEFTLSIPGAFELIEEFSAREELVVGAGTVLTVDDAQRRQGGSEVSGVPRGGRSGNRRSRGVAGGGDAGM